MINFKFNEERDIRNVVEFGNVNSLSIHKAIWNATLYYTQIEPVDKKIIFDTVVKFMEQHYSDFKYEGYVRAINKCINDVKKYRIKNIDSIKITKSEMNKIQSLNDIKKEKIAFVVLALAKYFNAAYENEKDNFYAKTSEIFKFARISIPVRERDYYLRFAYEEGILKPNYSIGNNAYTAAFVSHSDEEIVLELNESDYLEIAYTYLNYKNGGYKRCKTCGRWFKISVGKPNEQYCYLHKSTYESIGEYKTKTCIDCGKEFAINVFNNETCRCDICNEEHKKKVNRERQKRWYNNHKT